MTLHSKQDFQNLLGQLLNPLKPLYSPGGALLDLGKTSAHYLDHIAWLEGFSRPLWGLVPFWAGGGSDKDFEEIYRKGLASGSDPAGPEYWGTASGTCQRFVEMAAIGVGLILAPDKVWEPLNEQERDNLAKWLYHINEHPYPDNNWWFFEVLVNTGLRKVGKPYSQKRMDDGFERVEAFYLGDGWYHDGPIPRNDYYVSFAIHFYGLIYSVAAQDVDPERCELYRKRAEEFAPDFLYWFDDSGEALPYGRSLTYRFAQAAFWSAYVYAGLDGVDSGVVKGVITRHLERWMESDMLDRDGILTIGYRYPNLQMSEGYNAPGSPYWAMKIFLLLALPDGHPFWSVEAKPMPKLEPLKKLTQADMLIQRGNGHVVAYPSGNYHPQNLGRMPQKYAKFAYSTKLGFSVPHSDEYINLAAPDSMLAFAVDGIVLIRRVSKEFRIDGDRTWSKWSPIQGIEVESEIIPTETGHKRRHVVRSEIDCLAYDCGFAVPNAESDIVCTAKCLSGNGEPETIIAAPNTSLMFSRTTIPSVKYEIHKGETVLETVFEAKL